MSTSSVLVISKRRAVFAACAVGFFAFAAGGTICEVQHAKQDPPKPETVVLVKRVAEPVPGPTVTVAPSNSCLQVVSIGDQLVTQVGVYTEASGELHRLLDQAGEAAVQENHAKITRIQEDLQKWDERTLDAAIQISELQAKLDTAKKECK